MNSQEFNKLVEKRMEVIQSILISKSVEYSSDNDKLLNFKEGADADGKSPEEVLWGFYLKHWLSLRKIVRESGQGKLPSLDLLAEKITDSINYHLLLEAILTEKINKENV